MQALARRADTLPRLVDCAITTGHSVVLQYRIQQVVLRPFNGLQRRMFKS